VNLQQAVSNMLQSPGQLTQTPLFSTPVPNALIQSVPQMLNGQVQAPFLSPLPPSINNASGNAISNNNNNSSPTTNSNQQDPIRTPVADAQAIRFYSRVPLPTHLQGYVRYVVVLDPQDKKPYSIGIKYVCRSKGADEVLARLSENVNRRHKKRVHAWLCKCCPTSTICQLEWACPDIHVTSIGYSFRRPWTQALGPNPRTKADGDDEDGHWSGEDHNGHTAPEKSKTAKQAASTSLSSATTVTVGKPNPLSGVFGPYHLSALPAVSAATESLPTTSSGIPYSADVGLKSNILDVSADPLACLDQWRTTPVAAGTAGGEQSSQSADGSRSPGLELLTSRISQVAGVAVDPLFWSTVLGHPEAAAQQTNRSLSPFDVLNGAGGSNAQTLRNQLITPADVSGVRPPENAFASWNRQDVDKNLTQGVQPSVSISATSPQPSTVTPPTPHPTEVQPPTLSQGVGAELHSLPAPAFLHTRQPLHARNTCDPNVLNLVTSMNMLHLLHQIAGNLTDPAVLQLVHQLATHISSQAVNPQLTPSNLASPASISSQAAKVPSFPASAPFVQTKAQPEAKAQDPQAVAQALRSVTQLVPQAATQPLSQVATQPLSQVAAQPLPESVVQHFAQAFAHSAPKTLSPPLASSENFAQDSQTSAQAAEPPAQFVPRTAQTIAGSTPGESHSANVTARTNAPESGAQGLWDATSATGLGLMNNPLVFTPPLQSDLVNIALLSVSQPTTSQQMTGVIATSLSPGTSSAPSLPQMMAGARDGSSFADSLTPLSASTPEICNSHTEAVESNSPDRSSAKE
jgi:hypothetical protein